MPVTVTLNIDDFLEDGWAMPAALTDPKVYAEFAAHRADALFIGKPLLEGLNASQRSRLASKSYRKAWIINPGDVVVGDAVYISADDTLDKADATTDETADAVGFARYVNGAVCYIDHFVLKTGLVGGTRNAPVYLQDDGTFGPTAGTTTKVVGRYLSATAAYLCLFAVETGGGSSPATQVAKTANYTLTPDDCNKTITNTGAAGAVVIDANPTDLPEGFVFRLVNVEGEAFQFDAGGDLIMRGSEDGLVIDLDEMGYSAELEYMGGFWNVRYINGGGFGV